MRNIFKYKILVFLAGALLIAGCEDLQDINKNPNSLTDEPDAYLFTNACKYSVSQARQTLSRGMVMFTGPWSQMTTTGYAEDRYDFNADSDDESILWQDLYLNLAQSVNLEKLTGVGGSHENELRNAMCQVVSMIQFARITNLWGSVPYTEGAKGISYDIISPKYDTQEYIYKDIISRLGECISVFETADQSTGYGTADPFYAGQLSQWIKFANSFRLRLAMQMRFVDATDAATTITACLSKPLMASNDDNARILNFDATTTYLYSGWYETFQNEAKGSCKPSEMLVDTLNKYNDPRLPIFFTQNKMGAYKGYPNGITSAARGTIPDSIISSFQPVLYAKNIPSYFMCYSEVCFLKAEAYLYGLGGLTASVANAESEMQKGITAAMLQWGVAQADIDTYLATQSAATLTGSTEENFKKIIVQMWLSCITNYYEAYNVTRRTGYFILDHTGSEAPYPKALGATGGLQPRRLTYPSTESLYNNTNMNEAITGMGGDTRLIKVWWDVGRTPAK